MKAVEILSTAAHLVDGERDATHGPGRSNFLMTAALWQAYLGIPIRPQDVAEMLALTKVARRKCGSPHPDHWVDGAGYTAIAAELAQR